MLLLLQQQGQTQKKEARIELVVSKTQKVSYKKNVDQMKLASKVLRCGTYI